MARAKYGSKLHTRYIGRITENIRKNCAGAGLLNYDHVYTRAFRYDPICTPAHPFVAEALNKLTEEGFCEKRTNAYFFPRTRE